MSAAESLARIVSLVAELTRRERAGDPGATLPELASRFGVTQRQIEDDLRTLTSLDDTAEGDWLLSLRVWQQGDRVSASSQGPFQRPVTLTPEELLAVQVALIGEGELELARKIGGSSDRGSGGSGERGSGGSADWALAEAASQGRKARIRYAAEGSGGVRVRTVEPYQVLHHRNRTYLIAWCEEAGGPRHFRVDRIVAVEVLEDRFEPRKDFAPVSRPEDLFRTTAAVEEVAVRFRDGAARWARERYAGHETEAAGTVLVRFNVGSVDWLVRLVLEIGADAEVVGPPGYRRAIRDAVA